MLERSFSVDSEYYKKIAKSNKVNSLTLRMNNPEMQKKYREYQQKFVNETTKPYFVLLISLFFVVLVLCLLKTFKSPPKDATPKAITKWMA